MTTVDYRALTSASRAQQGLADQVEDDVVIARIAGLVARRDEGALSGANATITNVPTPTYQEGVCRGSSE